MLQVLKYKSTGKYVNTSRMPFGNGWDYGIGFAVLEAHNGDHVYIRMLHNGEDVELRDAKEKTSF